MRERFIVEGLAGEKKLKGDIAVCGAKNAALKFLAASILFEDDVRFSNMPDIEDVRRACELLRAAGAGVVVENGVVTVRQPVNNDKTNSPAPNPLPREGWGQEALWRTDLDRTIACRMRASIVFTGPMLARAGQVSFPFPGGCVLGERPIDLFLKGFSILGADVSETEDNFTVRAAQGLRGAKIFFPFISVTATETLILAAVLAHGETVIDNAATEPEIVSLVEMLNACGAHIEGVGTSSIRIFGTAGKLLSSNGKIFAVPPDRIEAGCFIVVAALAGNDVTIKKCEPKHLQVLLELLKQAGVNMEIGTDFVRIRATENPYKNVSVRTHEYPGFPTDLQAPMAIFLTQCVGDATILETIFDGRFRYAEDLIKMGADIIVMNPHKILVRGPKTLYHAKLESPDLRAGLAYIIAASIAHGTSAIDNAYLIDRGYERIEERLRGLGLNIKREKSDE